MSLSLGQLLGLLDDAKREAEPARQGAVDELGREAVPRIRQRWPRRTGLSGDAFAYERSAITNDVPYTPEVHDGLVYRLVPEVLEELDPTFADSVELRLGQVLEG